MILKELDKNLNAKLVEEFLGTFKGLWNDNSDIEIYKNPKSIKKMAVNNKLGSWNRAISDIEGNLFIADDISVTHSEIKKYLEQKDFLFDSDNHIMWQRYNTSLNFFLSSVYELDDHISRFRNKLINKVQEKNPNFNFYNKSINIPY